MGTRADFYIGTEWIGSLAFDGYRIHEMKEEHADKGEDNKLCWTIKTAQTEAEYACAVMKLLSINDDGTVANDGWPWPWEDSRTTDYAYVFDGAQTRHYSWGKEIVAGDDDAEGAEPDGGWPDMSAVAKPAIGTKRDSVIVLSGK